jgi:hypothetical protein
MSRSLFRAGGIGVDVNGQQFDTGQFSRQGREWVAMGTTPTGIKQAFRYSVAEGLTLRLGGTALLPVMRQLVGQNITVTVWGGGRLASDNMVPAVETLGGLRLAPVAAGMDQ